MIGIYKIQNLDNGKIYIGQSVDIESRFRDHKWHLNNNKHRNSHLQNSWNVHGENAFDFSIIEECDYTELSEKEIYWIKYYDSFNNGYNATIGGEGCSIITEEKAKPICDAFNSEKYTMTELMEKFGFDSHKLRRYLIYGTIHRMCNYDPDKSGLIKVICLTTGEVFNSLKEAEEKYQINNIGESCKHHVDYVGKLNDGTPLIWLYLKEYNEMTEEEIYEYKKNIFDKTDKRVICLNTKQIFNDVFEAAKWCGLESHQMVAASCNNKSLHAGVHPETKERLCWEYMRNYQYLSKEDIINKIHKAKYCPDIKPVICLNNLDYYNDPREATLKYKTNLEGIKRCCRHDTNSSGFLQNGERATWAYYEDYIKMSSKEIDDKLLLSKYKYCSPDTVRSLVCLNNNYLFIKQKDISEWCGLKNPNNITYNIKHYNKNKCGKHPKTGEPLYWMLLEDYQDKYDVNDLTEYTTII